MRHFERDGREHTELRDAETATMRISEPLYEQLKREYFDWFSGVLSAVDGPTGTHWIFEMDSGRILSITATTGFDEAPAFQITPRPGATLSD